MEVTIFNINHHPSEYLSLVNIICDKYGIFYRIFSDKTNYKADILYNDVRYNGENHKSLEITLEDLFTQIKYLLAQNIAVHTPDDVLYTLEYVINKTKEYRKCFS